MTPATVEIYALYSGSDGRVRYVGKTKDTRASRFETHTKAIVGQYITRVYEWIHDEWRHGFPVQHALLETCDEDSWSRIETQWMNKFPDLLNDRKYHYAGGQTPSVREIREYMRSHRANSGGFRGVCWWGDIGYYTVLKPNGEWLHGHEAPGWGGNIFFSDRTAAITARDNYQRFSKQKIWLPDLIEPEL